VTIFDLITKDKYYFATALKISGNKEDAHDLMMDAALKIHDKGYELNHVRSLYYTIVLRDYIGRTKNYTVIEELLSDADVSQYQRDFIDCALALQPKTKREFVTINIFKLFLKYGSKSETARQTNIHRKVVEHHVNKFIKFAYENCRMFDN
jgi:predicted nucleic-acid-binding protein